MEISIYILVSKMSSFNQLLLSERLSCVSSLETLRYQGVLVQPLAFNCSVQSAEFHLSLVRDVEPSFHCI